MISAHLRGINRPAIAGEVEKELSCDQREEVHMVSGSPGPMQ